VLLNTLGKLIEKMISNRIQFDAVKYDVFHPNQVGGVRQRSTEDAGLYLTHVVRAGWAKGLKTSVLAFDLAQFFPSINHDVLLAVLAKQGFPPNVVKFFASYLVGRSTRYAWNAFTSPPRSADVGVGQGSALSPVLSALCLAPIMRLFEQHRDACWLLSYVDDGTLIVQSKSLDVNCALLTKAYKVIFELFTQFALVLEHDKSEIFHFDRSFSDYNPPIDLGYAPYTGATPLKPKPFWRYLGFFFDRKLTFHEHVRFYSTKAFSSVKAMKMLGSSTRGLEPKEKRLLYRSCVIPIATYGYRLWFFDGARCKGAMKLLGQMQRKAALWITGAFSTSPGPGVEALAGLLPFHLLLERLNSRAILRAGTLSETHPVRSLLAGHMLGKAKPHPLSYHSLTNRERSATKGPVMEIVKRLPELTEHLEPMALHARPGNRFRDRYWSRITFDESLLPLKTDKDRSLYLDFIYDLFMSDDKGLCIGTDASVYTNATSKKATQAIAAGVLYSQGAEVNRFRWLVGRATAPDAEQSAICRAIEAATQRSCRHVAIFTDSIGMAKRALDTSLHSSQAHSLRACGFLETWLAADPLRWISFHYVPTNLRWGIHHIAHEYASTAIHRPVDIGSRVTLDRLRMEADAKAAMRWAQAAARRPQDFGRNFLQLKSLNKKGAPLYPDARKGGPYIRKAGADNTSFARLCRCILDHAPIGSYYARFNIEEPQGCPRCGAPRETRSHILKYCPGYERNGPTDHLPGLVDFILENAEAFSFARQTAAPSGIG
jgi:hypothetical protein